MWNDFIQEYLGSEYYFLLDPSCKEPMESVLVRFFQLAQKGSNGDLGGFPELWTRNQMKECFRELARTINVSTSIKKSLPYMISEFFDYLVNSGKYPAAQSWHTWVGEFSDEFNSYFRKDGSVRGESVVHNATKAGRNDPCPCGSGKKFKKCCGK